MELSTYYIGASGHGQDELLLHHAIERLKRGHGVFMLDPHGDLVDTLIPYIPKRRRKDTLVFDPTKYCIGFNPVHHSDNPWLAADTMLHAFKDVADFHGSSTAQFDDVMGATLLTLLLVPDTTLLSARYLLSSSSYRQKVTDKLTDNALKDWWYDFETMTAKERRDDTRSTRNKLGVFTTDPRFKRTFGQVHPSFTMSDILQSGVFLCRLPIGQLSEDKTKTFGLILLAQLYLASLNRSDHTPFHVYLRDCDYFDGHTLRQMLSFSHYYHVHLHLSHQYLDQLDRKTESSIIGNITERYIFNVSRADTKKLEIEDGHDNNKYKFYELPRYTAMYQGDELSVPDLPPPPFAEEAALTSERRFARSQKKVDKEITAFFNSL